MWSDIMKKFLKIFIPCLLSTIIVLFIGVKLINEYGSYFANPVLKELPIYRSKEFYSSGFWMDYTDYAKFSYKNVAEEKIESSEYFSRTTEEDVALILDCIENFENWVEQSDEELKENYDFDKSIIDTGDFAYIDTAGFESATYDIYYFDLDTQMLYYFHNDI